MRSGVSVSVLEIADAAVRSAVTQLVNYLRAQPRIELTVVESLYTPPMYLRLEAEPTGGILCVRVREMPDQEAIVPHTSTVVFTWEGDRSRARIDAIGGMIVGTGQKYRFNFAALGTA